MEWMLLRCESTTKKMKGMVRSSTAERGHMLVVGINTLLEKLRVFLSGYQHPEKEENH